MTEHVTVRAEIDFEITEGDPHGLSEDEQFCVCQLIMEDLPQTQIVAYLGRDETVDEPALVIEPCGWKIDTDLWGDLAAGTRHVGTGDG